MNPLLGRWISADPLAVHAPGEADLNVYAYVSGEILRNIDPLGLLSEEAQKKVDEHGQKRAEVEGHQQEIDYEKELLEQEIAEKSYLAENEATDQDDLDARNAEVAELKSELESLKLKEANLKEYWQNKDAEFQRWFREETAPVMMAIPLARDAQGQTQAGEGVAIVQKSDLPQAEAARELRAVLDTNENIKNGGAVGVGLMGGTEATMRITEGRSATPEEMRNAAEVGARANGVLEGIKKGPEPTVKNPYTGPMRGGKKANKVKRQQQNKSRQQNRPNKTKEKRIKRKKERKSRGGTS